MLRGFSPCAIDSMPSITISRTCVCEAMVAFELRGDRQEEQVGEPDAVHRGGEGGGDALAELARIGEVLHHGHEAEHGADDAERRAVDAHALEHLRGRGIRVLAGVELHFHHARMLSGSLPSTTSCSALRTKSSASR